MMSVESRKTQSTSSRAWYGALISEFVSTEPNAVIGRLATASNFSLLATQKDAWLDEIEFLQHQLAGLSGSLFLEYSIPRMGRRIDAVLVIGPVVFVVEFKVGEKTFNRAGIDQVWDYALDLKNFHEASHQISIVPLLIATGAVEAPSFKLEADEDNVYRPIPVYPTGFRDVIDQALLAITGLAVDADQWALSPYRPTPTIVEAARTLYTSHSVEAIARYDAGAQNLRVTSQRIEELVEEAKEKRLKMICFVTGVPGAGKTLVGLNVATHRRELNQATHAVFLSGNGPLVAVLREALTRDEFDRKKREGNKVRKGKVGESVKAFIQNVHHFRDDVLVDVGPPTEHVVIFDEAQRAWNLKQTASFMQRKKKSHRL